MGAEIVSVKSLFWAMGIVFAAGAVQAFVTRGSLSGSVISLSAISGFLILAAFSWSWLEKVLGPRLVQSVYEWSSDFRVWLGLIVLLFLYGATTSIIGEVKRDRMRDVIENDMIPFRRALERWVLPRTLQPEQIRQISNHLGGFPASSVTLIVNAHDDEAEAFAGQFREAIDAAGWQSRWESRADLRSGLSVSYTHTAATNQRPRDPRNPLPHATLLNALRVAGVQIQSSGGGMSRAIEHDVLELQVGRRPHGPDAPPQNWPQQ